MSFRAVRVRMRGLEPPRPEGHTDLNRARLPIPPHPRAWDSVAGCRRGSETRLVRIADGQAAKPLVLNAAPQAAPRPPHPRAWDGVAGCRRGSETRLVRVADGQAAKPLVLNAAPQAAPRPPPPRAWDGVAGCRRRSETRLRANQDDESRAGERSPRFTRPRHRLPGPADREDAVRSREAPVAALVPEGGEL